MVDFLDLINTDNVETDISIYGIIDCVGKYKSVRNPSTRSQRMITEFDS